MVKIQELREIIQLVNESSFEEFQFEIEEAKMAKILIKKGNSSLLALETGNSIEELPSNRVSTPDESNKQDESFISESNLPKNETPNVHKIVSPMVGTFYAAPEPDAKKFVRVGDEVEPNTVVCMVEAMKLYNEIEAEVRGEIVEILAENGQMVDYGQALFLVKPE
ncbi:acetyl-CoA carboxylase biotin carboxyl carrier protein [Peribacillus saganii]|uniref:Biotin carboxyl carrier protein of acetyl-CoA carboxylase n=1 Tax=Peribacillus saganii TaxID=2303992 RepID=A0A372LQ06_9BACI|nr:acetyl-CoA carboxylase biotin carboxyl carrier protein [Peribacillus saganii]RFU70295.1 acetyl-CoA carboxylase biotin carboxyl carrier protein [Peribacillus saganii]